MSKTAKVDMLGKTFGRLTVVQEVPERNKNGHIMYLCECLCGNTHITLGSSLRKGSCTSCGCAQKDAVTTHNLWKSPEYKIWVGIKYRCLNPSAPKYSEWGGRGIDICSEWAADFTNFIRDMGPRPSPAYSIDRINNDLGYFASNCRWATAKEQVRNRRITIKVLHEGALYYMEDFAIKIGLTESGARKRLKAQYKLTDGIFIKEEDSSGNVAIKDTETIVTEGVK